MRTQRLGEQGLTVSAMGLGCMGMSRCLWARRRGRVPRDHPSGPGSGDQSPRHVGRLRPVHQRGAGRQGDPRQA